MIVRQGWNFGALVLFGAFCWCVWNAFGSMHRGSGFGLPQSVESDAQAAIGASQPPPPLAKFSLTRISWGGDDYWTSEGGYFYQYEVKLSYCTRRISQNEAIELLKGLGNFWNTSATRHEWVKKPSATGTDRAGDVAGTIQLYSRSTQNFMEFTLADWSSNLLLLDVCGYATPEQLARISQEFGKHLLGTYDVQVQQCPAPESCKAQERWLCRIMVIKK
jgi:hypothetical protein